MAETRFYLIEYQQETMLIRQLPQSLQVTRYRLYNADILQYRLQENAGHRIPFKNIGYRIEIIKIDHMHQRLLRFRNTRRDGSEWVLPGAYPAANLSLITDHVGRHVIVPAIVSALHDNDMIPARGGPCNSDGMEGCFRARAGQLDAFYPGHIPAK